MELESNSQNLIIVKREVRKLLGSDRSGHADDHVERVAILAGRFADSCGQSVDKQEVLLTAWLHDVDDYKLVGQERADLFENTIRILSLANTADDMQAKIIENISGIGYKKRLSGLAPKRLSGQLVSDADMCDAIGAVGIERALTYALNHGRCRIFDRNIWPDIDIDIDVNRYNSNDGTHETDSFINYFFEKMLKLQQMMLTEPGKRESSMRQQIMVDFLNNYFREKDAPEWGRFLDEYSSRL